MSERKWTNRSNMLKTYQERNFSLSSRMKISNLFKNYEEQQKEALAEKITKIINTSATEQEAMEQILKIKSRFSDYNKLKIYCVNEHKEKGIGSKPTDYLVKRGFRYPFYN